MFERRRDARLTMEDLKDVSVEAFIEIAKDKWKSRSLQRSLMESDEVVARLIYAKAEPIFTQLLSDQYGNYLSQKILEYCTDEQFDLLFSKVESKLSNLANEVHGTRAVQKFVEEGVKRNRTENILTALRDHVEPLSRSVTGFHVVVKLLEKLSDVDCEEILGKLCKDANAVVSMGKDQWGCCVLKACIDTAKEVRLKVIVDAIVMHTLDLVQDPYGNYVVQHVLANSNNNTLSLSFGEVLPQMIASLKDHVLDLCQQKFSSNVLEKLLTTAPEPHKQILIQGVLTAGKLETSEVAQHLLFHQYGNYVLQQTLAVAREPQHAILLEAVRPFVHQVLRHLFNGAQNGLSVDDDVPGSLPGTSINLVGSNGNTILTSSATSLAPEQAQRLAMKLVKRFPGLLEGLDENEKAMLAGPSYESTLTNVGSGGQWNGSGPDSVYGSGFNSTFGGHFGSPSTFGTTPSYYSSWNQQYAMAQWSQQYSQLLAMSGPNAQGQDQQGQNPGNQQQQQGSQQHHNGPGPTGQKGRKHGGKGGKSNHYPNHSGKGGKNQQQYGQQINQQQYGQQMQQCPSSQQVSNTTTMSNHSNSHTTHNLSNHSGSNTIQSTTNHSNAPMTLSNTSTTSTRTGSNTNNYNNYYLHAQKAAQALASLNALQQANALQQIQAQAVHVQHHTQQLQPGMSNQTSASPPQNPSSPWNPVVNPAVHANTGLYQCQDTSGGQPMTYSTKNYYGESSPESDFWPNYGSGNMYVEGQEL